MVVGGNTFVRIVVGRESVTMGGLSIIAKSVVGREFVSTVNRKVFAKSVVGRQFFRTVKGNVIAKSVVGVFCARPHCVRLGQTPGTKDTAHVALFICSRVSPIHAITRRRSPL